MLRAGTYVIGMPAAHVAVGTALRHLDLRRQRRAAEDAQVDLGDHVPGHAGRRGDPPRGVELGHVPLAVLEAQGVRHVALALGDREHRGRVETAAQQDDCVLAAHRPSDYGEPGRARHRRARGLRFRAGFKSGGAFGDLESPAVCQSGAAVIPLSWWAPDRQTCGDPGPAQRAERTQGLRGNGSRLLNGFQPDLRAGIRSRSLRAPRPRTRLLKPVLGAGSRKVA